MFVNIVIKHLWNVVVHNLAHLGFVLILQQKVILNLITWDGSKKSGKFGIGGGLCGFYRFGDLPALAQHAKKPSIADIEKLDETIRNCGKLPLPTTPASAKNAKFIRENFTNFPYTLKQQVDYLISIINDRYSDIKTQSSPSDAALWWCRKYERPACVTDRWQRYGKNSNEISELLVFSCFVI